MGRAKTELQGKPQHPAAKREPRLKLRSEAYDEVKAAKAVRRLSKRMRAIAAQRQPAPEQREAAAEQRWSYLVEATIAEIEEEAALEQRLLELRIALLQAQPACRHLLAGLRSMVMESSSDQALPLLRYAVAWRRVFGAKSANRLQAVLDLAAMGAVVRNHLDEAGHETVYVANDTDLEAFRWNRRGSALDPSDTYLGAGFVQIEELTGKRREITDAGRIPMPAVAPVRSAPLPPVAPAPASAPSAPRLLARPMPPVRRPEVPPRAI